MFSEEELGDQRIASRQRGAWIETSIERLATFYAYASPLGNEGRGLKPLEQVGEALGQLHRLSATRGVDWNCIPQPATRKIQRHRLSATRGVDWNKYAYRGCEVVEYASPLGNEGRGLKPR